MKYIKPALTLETYKFEPIMLDVSSIIEPIPGPPDVPTTKKPVIESNRSTIEMSDAFDNIFNFN